MSVQSYNEATAESAHGDIGSVISGLEATLADLGGFVKAVKSQWDGDEMEAYGQIQQKWDSNSDNVKSILAAVHGALGENTQSVRTMRGRVTGALMNPSS